VEKLSSKIAAVSATGIVLAAGLLAAPAAVADPVHAQQAPAEQTPVDTSKPYMGWSTFSQQVYHDGGNWLTEENLLAQADAMRDKLGDAGYEYVNIDAGWNDGTDEFGRPVPSAKVFPSGFQSFIDHVHGNGQKVGIYMIPGIGQDLIDAAKPVKDAPGCTTADIVKQPLQQADYWGIGYALDFSNDCTTAWATSVADVLDEWGIDFVKFDSVTPGSGITDGSMDARDDVAAWSKLFDERGMWFELSWAVDINQADYWKKYADGWRVEWDGECYCGTDALTTWDNVARLFPRLEGWWKHAGREGFNDLDSLNIGNAFTSGLTDDERQTAMTLWSMNAGPLYLGTDMTDIDDLGLKLMTNEDAIAINQGGHPARPIDTSKPQQVWYSSNDDGSFNVALYNLGRTAANVTVDFADVGIDGDVALKDIWGGTKIAASGGSYTAALPVHGSQLLRVTPGKGATVAIDGDDVRTAYEGEWQRNGGYETLGATQTLPVAIGDGAVAPEVARETTINNNDDGLVYQGNWSDSTGRGLGDYNDDVRYTESNGASVSYTFTGTQVKFFSELANDGGEIDVYLDDAFVKTVSGYADQRAAQQVLFDSGELEDGTHAIRLVKKTGQYMLVDRFDYAHSSLLEPQSAAFDRQAPADIELTSPRAGDIAGIEGLVEGTDYALTDTGVTISADYLAAQADGQLDLSFTFEGDDRDSVQHAGTDGSAVELTFTGTSATWYAPVAPDQGTVDVYVDGKKVATVDTRADVRSAREALFTTEKLKDGEHTVRVVATSGDVVRHDGFRYTVKKSVK